ncbi:IclR family transcriptional regulator [Blastococcus sp. MG754426]|uniref:IclR family transcriptional regulator n=1 Tax=unclassified Blastococcus TaxID=2619396 RepID=UPI001EF0765E|nr:MULTISPECIES: IclR family transcriptional regulator [unclassified Blastococcus]MCF6508973.1 IclR family transcriptional regulator [Blastococcus sp. MG754426]MCF6513658.1 IclR family transcriptional regulator [Blastococcus sp. MG754427]MCF6736445.1 IclR family transcriptional regulator [Blastococcus sp. KM273129]
MAGGSASPGRSVTSRALGILDAFDSSAPRLSLSEIAERSGTPLTTAHRLLGELTGWGALVRRPDGRYEIGRKLWDLGLIAPVQLELRQVAAPFLLDLHTTTRDTVHLAVREGVSALYVERVSGRESVPVVSQVGSRLPLHATGVGKVLLAAAPDDVVERVLGALRPVTPHTVTDPAVLARELAEIRRRRYARTSQEMSLGAASLAVPVQVERAGGPLAVAALGIVVPPHRRDLSRLVPALEMAARGIGRELARSREFH